MVVSKRTRGGASTASTKKRKDRRAEAGDDDGAGDDANRAGADDDEAQDAREEEEEEDDENEEDGVNGSYVGVRDADVGELSTQYTQRAEAQEALEGGKMSREEVDRLVAEVMRFMLFMTHKENGAPVTRTRRMV